MHTKKTVAALTLALSTLATAQTTVTHHSGLNAPVSTVLINDAGIGSGFLIAESGTGNSDGRVTFLEEGTNARHEVVVGLPSDIVEGFPSGCHDAILSGGNLYVALGDNSFPLGYNSVVLRYDLAATPWAPGSNPLTLGDAAEVINVRGFVKDLGYRNTNVYSIAEGANGNIGVVDSGANSLLSYNVNSGNLSHVVEFPAEPNPTPVGPPMIDSVPTKVRFDGTRFQVATLTGFPFLPGLAKIYRVANDGSLDIAQDGLTLVTDFDYDPSDGLLTVAEFAAGFDLASGFIPNSGNVIKIDPNGDRVPLSRDQNFLTSMQFGGDSKPYFGSIANGELYRVEPGVMTYCEGSPNSAGSGAVISNAGSVSVSANDLALTCSGMPADTFSMLVMGTSPTQVPLGDGYLCLGGPNIFRIEIMKSSGGGNIFYSFDNTDLPNNAGSILPGETRNFQFWYRDQSFGANGNNLSNALQILFKP